MDDKRKSYGHTQEDPVTQKGAAQNGLAAVVGSFTISVAIG